MMVELKFNFDNLSDFECDFCIVNGEKYVKETKEAIQEDCGVFEPKGLDEYWYVDACGDVCYTKHDNSSYDDKIVVYTPVFRTEAEAEHQGKKQRVEIALRKLSGGYKFKRGASNYSIAYDPRDGEFSIEETMCTQELGATYFPTEETAQHAIDTLGDELVVLSGGES